MSDNTELISLAKSGDEAALTQIYNENANKVYFLCLKLLKNSEDASDIMQDTFIKAFSNLEQLKNPNALTSWLFSIATSLCKNHLVRSKKFVFSSDDDENPAPLQNIEETDDAVLPEQYADNSETRRLVMDIIDRLPDGQRIAVILFYYNEMSIKEISSVLECSEEAVKTRLFNARQKIKNEVLKLEEKGTKLYGVPIIPLLGSILNYEAIGTIAPAMSSSLSASLIQAAQASTNIQTTAAVSVKAAATGGKVMTKMTKIIIAALAAVVVAGGAITAAVIANNNNNSVQTQGISKNGSSTDEKSKDESSKKDDESSASEPTSEEPSSEGPSTSSEPSSQEPSSSEPSSENSEEALKAEEEAAAQEIHAQVISCGLYDAEELFYSKDSENKKYTRLVFMFTTPNKSGQAYNILSGSKSLKLYDKNGEIDTYSFPTYYKMNDNSCVYIINMEGEYNVDDLNVKLYSSKTSNTYDIKEFNRSEAKINYATGQISAGDYVKINGNSYIYAGIALTTSGYTGSDSKNEDRDYAQVYHEFVSISSNHERMMTDDGFKIDYSGTTSLPKSEYPLEAMLSVNDDESIGKVLTYKKCSTIEVCMFEVDMILPHDNDIKGLDELWDRDAQPYEDALKIVYEDKDSDYSFTFNNSGY